MRNVLVPLDGSAEAEAALPCAELLAGASGARLILLRAVPPARAASTESTAAAGDAAVHYLATIQSRLAPRIRSLALTCAERADDAIVQEIDRGEVDLVVMATHARIGIPRLLRGSVAARVVARASVPVLLVRAAAEQAPSASTFGTRVLVPLDGSAFSERALPVARAVAALLSARLRLMAAVAPPETSLAARGGIVVGGVGDDLVLEQAAAINYLENVAEDLAADCWPSVAAPLGHPVQTIADEARKGQTALVVMATHGRRGLARLAKGSVAEAVVQQTDRPVLLVPPRYPAGGLSFADTAA